LRFGDFKRPSRRAVARQRQSRPERMFEPADLLTIIRHASRQMRAMVLLGLNCGFGNNDCATLSLPFLKLDSGWLDYPRPKNGTARRCPLWPETIAALRDVLAHRKAPKAIEDAKLVFVTKYGQAWFKTGTKENPISHRFRHLLLDLGLHGDGLSFYTLRHVFETIAGGSRDQVAVDAIMGHVDGTMAGTYRERIDDDRLRAVVHVVREWLGPKKLAAAMAAAEKAEAAA